MSAAHDPAIFRRVLGHYPTGVCVITAQTPNGPPMGLAVGSFTSVSLDPPLVGFLPDKNSRTWPAIADVGRFCVNVLARTQLSVCRAFAKSGDNKFSNLNYRYSDAGMPILEGVVAWLDCTLHAVYEAGDHFFVLGAVEALDVERPELPLLFLQGAYGEFTPLPTAVGGRRSDQ